MIPFSADLNPRACWIGLMRDPDTLQHYWYDLTPYDTAVYPASNNQGFDESYAIFTDSFTFSDHPYFNERVYLCQANFDRLPVY